MTSGYLRVQSGTPWAARARDAAGGTLNYLEPAGSHRNPTWTNLDLMATYRLHRRRPRQRDARSAAAERLRQPDAALDRRAAVSSTSARSPTPPFIAPYLQPNPFFGTGNAFAPPRRLYLGVGVTF